MDFFMARSLILIKNYEKLDLKKEYSHQMMTIFQFHLLKYKEQ